MRDVSKFLAGFRRFQHNYLGAQHAHFDHLVQDGQHPRALVIACCDSRCDPALLTDCDPGDMFVVRNVANLVPPETKAIEYTATSAAMAFAVRNLGVEHIIILGHAQCGGIRNLVAHNPPQSDEDRLIAKWLSIAEDAREKVAQELSGKPPETQAMACEKAAILVSLSNLMSYPWIRSRVEAGKLQLHGWYFDMVHGELLEYAPDNGEFCALVPHNGPGRSSQHLWSSAPG